MSRKKLVIFGFGGHARSVADVALACAYDELLFVDPNAVPNEMFLGHAVVQRLDITETAWLDAFAASGNGKQRRAQCDTIDQMGLNLVSLVSPLASVGVGSVIGSGSFVGHHAHIGPMATIGRSCIVNTGAIIEHESRVGNYSHVSVNATIAGRSIFGAFSMLGAGATIIDGVATADLVTIGAGAVVVDSIEVAGTYVGVPARRLK